MGLRNNFKKILIILLISLVTVGLYKFIFTKINSKKYNKNELHTLWFKVEKYNDKYAASQLLLFYTAYNFKDNLEHIAILKRKLLEPDSKQSCYLYGKFMVEFFEEDLDRFKEGIFWLKKAQALGSKEAEELLKSLTY